MKEIQLSRGLVALVDDNFFEMLNKYKWHAKPSRNTFYAETSIKNKDGKYIVTKMHRMIMGFPIGMDIDHVDRNGLNNQISNLQIVTERKNCCNRGIKKTSRFHGVSWHSQRGYWVARITIGKHYKHLGCFSIEEDAHTAYVCALKEIENYIHTHAQ